MNQSFSLNTRSVDRKRLLLSSALAGFGMAIFSLLPPTSSCNLFCCGWIWMGSAFAAWHYNYLGQGNKEDDQVENKLITPVEGVTVGIFSSLVAALVSGVIMYSMVSSLGVETLVTTTIDLYQKYMGIDPEVLNTMFAEGNMPTPLSLTLTNTIFNLLIYPILGGIGGILGSRFVAARASRNIQPPTDPM